MAAVISVPTIDVLVTGSRDWPFPGILQTALWQYRLQFPTQEMCIIHGANPHGADAIADEYARRLHWRVEPHPANWRDCGRAAGHYRNAQMRDRMLCCRSENHPVCMAFCLDFSRGTMDMLTLAREAEITVMLFSATLNVPGRINYEDTLGTKRILFGDYRQNFVAPSDDAE